MKDESEGKAIDEFVRLKSKMHYMKNIDSKDLIPKKSEYCN